MENYQPERHIPLEEIGLLFVGRTLVDMRGIAEFALERDTPLAFYSERSGERGEVDTRFFVGRDYQRMQPDGSTDYRIEILERIATESCRDHLDHFDLDRGEFVTSPLFRVWQISLAPPLRETRVGDSRHAQYGLQYLTRAYVLHQGRVEEYPEGVRVGLERGNMIRR